jgi:hypothetical protein
MGHDVYFPDSLPAFVGDFDAAAAAGYSCVGAKKIDRPAGGDRFVHKADKICFDAHVGGDGASADLTRNQPGTVNVDVSDDNCPGALGGKAAAQGPADAVCSTGYDDSFAGKLHVVVLRGLRLLSFLANNPRRVQGNVRAFFGEGPGSGRGRVCADYEERIGRQMREREFIKEPLLGLRASTLRASMARRASTVGAAGLSTAR